MDAQAMIHRLNQWLDAEFRVTKAHMDPAVQENQNEAIETELMPLLLTEAEWGGEAPFEPFQKSLEPLLATRNRQLLLDRLGRRTFFKADTWSAPDVGGIVRCLLGANEGRLTVPAIVFDLAELAGTIRLVAMHQPCPKCKAEGAADGAPCTYTAFDGRPCIDGMLPLGGLAFDPGEHLGGEAFATPSRDFWAAYMARGVRS